jgi:AAA+ ATPase superfamily predicted ATPase
MMMPVVGGPAAKKNFFDREKEVEDILKLLRTDSIVLISPRRYGKTSVMREVERRLIERGHLCLFLDIMSVDAPEVFLLELATAAFDVAGTRRRLVHALKDAFVRLSGLLEEIEASAAGTAIKLRFRGGLKEEIQADNWTERGRDVIDAIKIMSDEKPIYIVIDELSECVNNMIKKKKDAAKFLQWFRSIRQQTTGDLRFIVGGSISFHRVVKGISGLSWINDFAMVPIGGFSRSDDLRFIEEGFNEEGMAYRNEVGEKILECIGEPYVPYFTAIFLRMILQEAESYLTERRIEEIYSSKLLGAQGRGYFEYYKDRLKIYYGEPLARAAEEILGKCCLADQGLPKQLAFNLFRETTGIVAEERFVDLLYDLENDFYITFDGEMIKFQSKVLRDWWRLYNV